jgi:hypothetical protein
MTCGYENTAFQAAARIFVRMSVLNSCYAVQLDAPPAMLPEGHDFRNRGSSTRGMNHELFKKKHPETSYSFGMLPEKIH